MYLFQTSLCIWEKKTTFQFVKQLLHCVLYSIHLQLRNTMQEMQAQKELDPTHAVQQQIVIDPVPDHLKRA